MKNKKGFTLIELLAVIVILGLLMAIAIPSVTKYITESRKKTLTTTVGNYISALVNEVNDLSYTFTGQNTIYAVPIECIALERGGTNPFGYWYQANDAYFAYVLIQYDDVNSKYVYGFTFKDSAGYGLYPTIQGNINEKGKHIKTGYDLNKPVTGDLTSLTTLAKWQESGFKVDSTTNLHVLEATSENQIGDGFSTCTLCQKGENYAQVEEEKLKENIAYAIYSEDDKALTFIRSKNEIKVGDVYNGLNVTAVYTGFETNTYSWGWAPWRNYEKDITKVIVKEVISPISTAYWFAGLYNCSYMDLSLLDTSHVKDMKYMFRGAGYDVDSFKIIGLDNWDTSKVVNMDTMFYNAGYQATMFDIGDLSKWDTSSVTNMSSLFYWSGRYSDVWDIGDLSNWNISNVTSISSMFNHAGYQASNWNVGDLSNWDTSKVTSMSCIFYNVGINDLTWSVGDLSNWDTSNVTNMSDMFNGAGNSSKVWSVGDLGNWDTSNVTNMSGMFGVGRLSEEVYLIGIEKWDVSKVTDMSYMFNGVATNARIFKINDIGKWNTSSVEQMKYTFWNAGMKAEDWSLDLSNWDVSKVIDHSGFSLNVSNRVKNPIWVG